MPLAGEAAVPIELPTPSNPLVGSGQPSWNPQAESLRDFQQRVRTWRDYTRHTRRLGTSYGRPQPSQQETSFNANNEDEVIDIPEEAVSVEESLLPLEEGAAATGVLATGANTIVPTGIGLAGTAAAGYGIGKIISRNRGATIPGRHFLGPGNPIDKAPPTSYADQIAKEHDIAYANARLPEDIFKADQDAIKKFDKAYKQFGGWDNLAGKVGLKLKHKIEANVGVIYPRLPGT